MCGPAGLLALRMAPAVDATLTPPLQAASPKRRPARPQRGHPRGNMAESCRGGTVVTRTPRKTSTKHAQLVGTTGTPRRAETYPLLRQAHAEMQALRRNTPLPAAWQAPETSSPGPTGGPDQSAKDTCTDQRPSHPHASHRHPAHTDKVDHTAIVWPLSTRRPLSEMVLKEEFFGPLRVRAAGLPTRWPSPLGAPGSNTRRYKVCHSAFAPSAAPTLQVERSGSPSLETGEPMFDDGGLAAAVEEADSAPLPQCTSQMHDAAATGPDHEEDERIRAAVRVRPSSGLQSRRSSRCRFIRLFGVSPAMYS